MKWLNAPGADEIMLAIKTILPHHVVSNMNQVKLAELIEESLKVDDIEMGEGICEFLNLPCSRWEWEINGVIQKAVDLPALTNRYSYPDYSDFEE